MFVDGCADCVCVGGGGDCIISTGDTGGTSSPVAASKDSPAGEHLTGLGPPEQLDQLSAPIRAASDKNMNK